METPPGESSSPEPTSPRPRQQSHVQAVPPATPAPPSRGPSRQLLSDCKGQLRASLAGAGGDDTPAATLAGGGRERGRVPGCPGRAAPRLAVGGESSDGRREVRAVPGKERSGLRAVARSASEPEPAAAGPGGGCDF